MSSSSHDRGPDLTLVAGAALSSASDSRPGSERPVARDLDWSVYMARAQAGDREAYRRLLEDVAPYLRSIASRHFRNSGDIEDAATRSEEHTSELQSPCNLVCRLLLEKKKKKKIHRANIDDRRE